MKMYEANQHLASEKGADEEVEEEEDEVEDGKEKEDDLYALLTKSKEASKASKSPQSSGQRSTNKLMPGNVNRLLSKGNSRS